MPAVTLTMMARPAERRAFLLKQYHFDIDAGAPLPPPPAWQEAHLSGARCEWWLAGPPSPLDPADRHLTALSGQCAPGFCGAPRMVQCCPASLSCLTCTRP